MKLCLVIWMLVFHVVKTEITKEDVEKRAKDLESRLLAHMEKYKTTNETAYMMLRNEEKPLKSMLGQLESTLPQQMLSMETRFSYLEAHLNEILPQKTPDPVQATTTTPPTTTTTPTTTTPTTTTPTTTTTSTTTTTTTITTTPSTTTPTTTTAQSVTTAPQTAPKPAPSEAPKNNAPPPPPSSQTCTQKDDVLSEAIQVQEKASNQIAILSEENKISEAIDLIDEKTQMERILNYINIYYKQINRMKADLKKSMKKVSNLLPK